MVRREDRGRMVPGVRRGLQPLRATPHGLREDAGPAGGGPVALDGEGDAPEGVGPGGGERGQGMPRRHRPAGLPQGGQHVGAVDAAGVEGDAGRLPAPVARRARGPAGGLVARIGARRARGEGPGPVGGGVGEGVVGDAEDERGGRVPAPGTRAVDGGRVRRRDVGAVAHVRVPLEEARPPRPSADDRHRPARIGEGGGQRQAHAARSDHSDPAGPLLAGVAPPPPLVGRPGTVLAAHARPSAGRSTAPLRPRPGGRPSGRSDSPRGRRPARAPGR